MKDLVATYADGSDSKRKELKPSPDYSINVEMVNAWLDLNQLKHKDLNLDFEQGRLEARYVDICLGKKCYNRLNLHADSEFVTKQLNALNELLLSNYKLQQLKPLWIKPPDPEV